MNYYTQFYLNKLANFGLQSPEPIPPAPTPPPTPTPFTLDDPRPYPSLPQSLPQSQPQAINTLIDRSRRKPFLPKEITDQQGKNSQKFITDGSATSRQVLQNAYPTTPLQSIIDSASKYKKENEKLTQNIRQKLDDKTLDEKVPITYMKPAAKGDPDDETYGQYLRWSSGKNIKPESRIEIKPGMTPYKNTSVLGHEFTHKLQSRPAPKGWPTNPVTGKLLSLDEPALVDAPLEAQVEALKRKDDAYKIFDYEIEEGKKLKKPEISGTLRPFNQYLAAPDESETRRAIMNRGWVAMGNKFPTSPKEGANVLRAFGIGAPGEPKPKISPQAQKFLDENYDAQQTINLYNKDLKPEQQKEIYPTWINQQPGLVRNNNRSNNVAT